MIKNKVLTPVLAGVLGVSVVGSGVGYYLVNKDGKNGVKPEETMDSMKISLTQVEETVDNTVTDVEKAVKGELDYAYDSNLKISFGNGALKNTTGTQLPTASFKPIELNTKVVQKGQNTEAAISAAYNDVTIATLETVYARDSKTAYFRIPELSSSYIKTTEEDLKKLFEDTAKKYTSKYENRKSTVPGTTNGNKTTDSIAKPDLKSVTQNLGLPDLSSVDSKKLEEKLKEYADIVKGKLPAKQDNGTVSGEIDGNKYDYKVESYSITGKLATDVANAVIDKMAGDADLKKYYEDFIKKNNKSGQKAKTYAELIAEMKKTFTASADQQNKTAVLDVYLDGEEFTGCSLSMDGKNYVKAVLVSKDDVNAIDVNFHDEKGSELFSVKGSAKLNDGKMDGTYVIKAASGQKNSFTGTLKLDKVVIKDDLFSGTIKFDVTADKNSFSISLSGKSTKENKNLVFSMDANGQNAIKVEFTQNKTEATDVQIPTGKFFTLDQLEQYKATCDFETFKSNLTKAIGTDIFGALGTLGKLGQNTAGSQNVAAMLDDPDMYEMYSF